MRLCPAELKSNLYTLGTSISQSCSLSCDEIALFILPIRPVSGYLNRSARCSQFPRGPHTALLKYTQDSTTTLTRALSPLRVTVHAPQDSQFPNHPFLLTRSPALLAFPHRSPHNPHTTHNRKRSNPRRRGYHLFPPNGPPIAAFVALATPIIAKPHAHPQGCQRRSFPLRRSFPSLLGPLAPEPTPYSSWRGP